ncbi:MAG: hypothetical protein N4A59_00555 [Marinifilum sp.]|jgi:hypothetical protein|nr:hypothetical protein [Marinifilum sp.]
MKFVQGSLILLFVLLTATVSAKRISEAEKRAEVITEWMTEKLDLSTEQISKVKELNLECEKEIDRLTAEKAGFPCMQAVRDSLLKKEIDFKKILTKEQLYNYIKLKCELKEQLKKNFKNLHT